MHTPLHAYESREQALAHGLCDRAASAQSKWRLPLSPSAWQFQLTRREAEAPEPRLGVGFDDAGWASVTVPRSVEMEGFGMPQYTNVRYPPPLNVHRAKTGNLPLVADENSVLSYQRRFTLPSTWTGRRVLLQLDGVGSAFTAWVDGIEVGYSQDSKLPAEFDITAACTAGVDDGVVRAGAAGVAGTHVLSVRVMKWSDGSYLEDQDQWWLSGIQRDVFVYSKPMPLAIVNYSCTYAPAPRGETNEGASSPLVHIQAVMEGDAADLGGFSLHASLLGPMYLEPGTPPPANPPEVWSVLMDLEHGSAPVAHDSADGPRATNLPHADAPLDATATSDATPASVSAARGLLGTGRAVGTAAVSMESAALWSAEDPALYTLVLELRREAGGRGSGAGHGNGACADDEQHDIVDVEACWVGLRHVTIEDGLIRVNGARVTFCGVNRHEHCPNGGKAISWATMLRDAQMMKRANFNAVRCSHYPNAQAWYELCDALGLYLIDEANIETHGFAYTGDEGRLAKRPAWRSAFFERFTRMVQRDHNHASIIIWSLGNEAGYGPTFDEMASWSRTHEPTRPVQYESGGGNVCTDIICPMYPSEATLVALATVRGQCASSLQCGQPEPTRMFPAARHTTDPRPLVVCEYAHAMGNSTGNLDEWWDLFRSLHHCQGGFIWDWVDQGLPWTDARGGKCWGYGGDYGEEIHDARFCINGLVLPDRTPKPCLVEVAHVQQPLTLELVSFEWPADKKGSDRSAVTTLRLTNRYDCSTLDHLEGRLSLQVHGCQIAASTFDLGCDVETILAGASREISLRLPLAEIERSGAFSDWPPNPLAPGAALLLVHFSLREASNWADAGHRVASHQLKPPSPPSWLLSSLATETAAKPRPVPHPSIDPHGSPPLSCKEQEKVFVVSGGVGDGSFEIEVSKVHGGLAAVRQGGMRLLEAAGGLQLWRAPTDNDLGSGLNAVTNPKDASIGDMVWWLSLGVRVVRRLPHFISPVAWSHSDLWKLDGLHALTPRVRRVARVDMPSSGRPGDGGSGVAFESVIDLFHGSELRATHSVTTTVLASGTVLLSNEAVVLSSVETLPRLGVTFRLPATLDRVAWLGFGPHENYPDRKGEECGDPNPPWPISTRNPNPPLIAD